MSSATIGKQGLVIVRVSTHMPRYILSVSVLCFLLVATNCEIAVQECSADGSCSNTITFEKGEDQCLDHHASCSLWGEEGECQLNPSFMFQSCSKTCDVCFGDKRQHLDAKVGVDRIVNLLQETKQYLEMFQKNETVNAVWSLCAKSLANSMCAGWAALGECDANPAYMRSNCAAVCKTCDLFDVRFRCPIDNEHENAWRPGDLNRFFLNITANVDHDKNINILSQPPDGPWIVTIDNFISPDEANRLIELGETQGYKRSFGVGGLKEDGKVVDIVSSGRTSRNAWCQDACLHNETSQLVSKRISDLTSIPSDNQEHFQLLSYDVGQFYKSHHDLIPHHLERQPGVRILTVFLYLNSVEAGGGTRFPRHENLTVQPELGRALIWPSVLDDDPHSKDPRTEHEALPVLAGHKYAANAWIHQRNYKVPHSNDCQ